MSAVPRTAEARTAEAGTAEGAPAAASAPDASPPGTGDGTTTGSRLAARWRRLRAWVALAVLILLGAALTALVAGRPGTGDLEPDSAEPGGSRAVAEVLGRQGVDVTRVARVADAVEAVEAAGASGATVLVVDVSLLGPAQLDTLDATGADLVLVEPDATVLDRLAPALAPAGTADAAVVEAGCEDPAARAAGRATGGGLLVRATGDGGATVCFEGAAAVAEVGDGRTVRVLGQRAVLENGSVATAGNAALALHALGENQRLVWLMAGPLDAAAEGPSAIDLLPGWVPWLAVHLAAVAALLAVWRGRRLGPVVTEPLPVVVRSAETAEGRATLYRRAGAYGRAATVLRAAAMRRLGHRLGLPAGASARDVVAAVAAATGRAEHTVEPVLAGPAPGDGAALAALADDLDALEAAVASADRPGAAPAVTAVR